MTRAYNIPKKKLTKRQINYYEKDELKARNQYKKLGLNELAKDENDHYNYFKNLKKKENK